jgi:hypothetical protein
MDPFAEISAAEHDRQVELHAPLTAAIRRLLEASISTGADSETIRRAQLAVEQIADTLEDSATTAHGPCGTRTPAGRWCSPIR